MEQKEFKLLPAAGFLLNFCKNRYLFAVGMGAAALCRQTMLLPPTHNQELLAQLQKVYPTLYVLYDDEAPEVLELPLFRLDSALLPSNLNHKPQQNPEPDFFVPDIPATHVMAYVFTSGSTGKPEPHAKTWGSLCRNAQAQLCRITENVNFMRKVVLPFWPLCRHNICMDSNLAFCSLCKVRRRSALHILFIRKIFALNWSAYPVRACW